MMNFKSKKAQTAIELAVFGSILIFVLGATIRGVIGRAHQQHALLRATRMALTMSHVSTESKTIAGRNMASVLIVEDRLTATSTKYGAIDRMPFMTQGSGIHSANLFMPIDYGDSEDLPVFDIFVNGRQFAFRTAAFKHVNLANSCRNEAPCPADCVDGLGVPDCTATSPFYYRGSGIPPGPDYWEAGCIDSTITTTVITACAGEAPCPPACSDCGAASTETYNVVTTVNNTIGCAKLYLKVNNHPLIPDWCNGGVGAIPIPCPGACSVALGPGCNLSADERFSLDRPDAANPDGLDGVLGTIFVLPAERSGFAWQWFLVAGVDESWTRSEHTYLVSDLAKDMDPGTIIESIDADLRMAEGIVFAGEERKAKNISIDVDYDLKLEKIMPNVEDGVQPNETGGGGVITRIGVMDPHEGDIDFTYNTTDELAGIDVYGFMKDVNLYTYVHGGGPKGGTYFQIDEGDIFLVTAGDTRQFIRTASKKDQIDVIERIFRLSNDTGAFCGTVPGANPPPGAANGISNPVEVCGWGGGECFISGNINRTCMDVPNKLIFIRSRIEDLHGRSWVTDEDSDPYVNFVIN